MRRAVCMLLVSKDPACLSRPLRERGELKTEHGCRYDNECRASHWQATRVGKARRQVRISAAPAMAYDTARYDSTACQPKGLTWNYLIAVDDSAELEAAAILLPPERRQEQLPETVEVLRPRRALRIRPCKQQRASVFCARGRECRMGLSTAGLWRYAHSAAYRFNVSAGESTGKSHVSAGLRCSGIGVTTSVEARSLYNLFSLGAAKRDGAAALGSAAPARAAARSAHALRDKLWRTARVSSLAFFSTGSIKEAHDTSAGKENTTTEKWNAPKNKHTNTQLRST